MALNRSSDEKVIGGVAAGIAAYFEMQPIVVRSIFLIAGFINGAGVVIYLILWVALPEARIWQASTENNEPMNMQESQPSDEDKVQNTSDQNQAKGKTNRSNIVGGLVLITFGALFLAEELFPAFDFENYWPIILIVIGVGLIVSSFKRKPER